MVDDEGVYVGSCIVKGRVDVEEDGGEDVQLFSVEEVVQVVEGEDDCCFIEEEIRYKLWLEIVFLQKEVDVNIFNRQLWQFECIVKIVDYGWCDVGDDCVVEGVEENVGQNGNDN